MLWSVAQIASAGCRVLPQLFGARVALGLGESPMYTGGTRVIADWYAEDERAQPIALFNSSASFGPAIAPAFLTGLMLAFGWRIAFVLLGLLGFAIAVAWLAIYRPPDHHGLGEADGLAPP